MFDKERKALMSEFATSWRQNVNNPLKRSEKHQLGAEASRFKGNLLYGQKEHDIDAHEEIWEMYTMSIALAPTGSEALALGYGNRSALLFHMSKFEDCIVDIDRALDVTKSRDLRVKLLCRKVKCLHALHDLPSAEKWLQEAKLYVDPDARKSRETLKVLGMIEATEKSLSKEGVKSNAKADESAKPIISIGTNDFSNVADKYNSKFGRHLVATRDIAPGEVIFVEKPYCTSILHHESIRPFCSHCCAPCLTTIPCDSCYYLMFCSEKCKNEAWKQYHDVECLVLEDWIEVEMSVNYMQAISRCIITEWRKSGSIANLRASLQSIDEKKKGKVIVNGELKISDLKLLCSSARSASPLVLSLISTLAWNTLISLATNTTFFGKKFKIPECKNLGSNKDVLFIGSLFLKLYNCSMYGVVFPKRQNLLRNGKDRNSIAGHSIPSVYASLITLDCNANVDKTYNRSNDLIVYAARPIKKDDQLFVSGGLSYAWAPADERQAEFLKALRNSCECRACIEDWPSIDSVKDILKSKPKNFEKLLFNSPLELELFKKHESVIDLVYNAVYDFECTEQMLSELSQSIEIAMKEFPQPSTITCLLLVALYIVCGIFYSYTYPIPDKCEKNKS